MHVIWGQYVTIAIELSWHYYDVTDYQDASIADHAYDGILLMNTLSNIHYSLRLQPYD